MNKKVIFILAGAVIIIIGYLYLMFLSEEAEEPISPTQLPTNFEEVPAVIELTVKDHSPSIKRVGGGRLPVRNFLADDGVQILADDFVQIFDVVGIGGSLASSYYYTEDGGMIILLTQEPLAVARYTAEEELKERLALSEEELCGLDILVQTNRYVNISYAGINLGLSFCPGSVSLE